MTEQNYVTREEAKYFEGDESLTTWEAAVLARESLGLTSDPHKTADTKYQLQHLRHRKAKSCPPYLKRADGSVRYRKSDVIRWAESHKRWIK